MALLEGAWREVSGSTMFRQASMSRVVRASLGASAGVCCAAGAQGFYLASQYSPLEPPRGPLTGIAACKEAMAKPLRRLRSGFVHSAAAAAALPPHNSVADREQRRPEPHACQPQASQVPEQHGQAAPGSTAPGSISTGVEHEEQPSLGNGWLQSGRPWQPRPRKNILFVGDSLVVGVGCSPHEAQGPALPRKCAEFLANALKVDVQWTAIGETGADVRGLNLLLPAVGREVKAAQARGGTVDMVVVVVGLNDFKKAYQSLPMGSLRRTAIGFKSELDAFVSALHAETGVHTTVVLPALPLHMAPVFTDVYPLKPLLMQLAHWYDEKKRIIAESSRARCAALQHGGLPSAAASRVCFVDDGSAEGDRWGASIWAKDGIHPNEEGYRIWGEHIARSIVKQALLSS